MKKVRNTVARLAIMRKGGVHEKTNKAKRRREKQSFKKQIRTKNFGPFCLWRSKTKYDYRNEWVDINKGKTNSTKLLFSDIINQFFNILFAAFFTNFKHLNEV